MPYDALGNYVPGDESAPTIEDMRYALSKRGPVNTNPYTYGDVFGGVAKGAISNLESLGRGATAVIPAALGELESAGRHLVNFSFGPGGVNVPTKTYLPTTEDVLASMPERITPARPESAGMEMLGAALNLPGQDFGIIAPLRALGSIPGALRHGAEEFMKASVAGAPHAVKSKGGAPGNWITSLGRPLEEYPGMLGTHINEQKEISRYPDNTLEDNRVKAWNKWVEGPYLKYITNEMGSGAETDSLVRLAEKEGIHVGRTADPGLVEELKYTADSNRDWAKASGLGGTFGKQTAKTPLGQLVEDATDSSVLINDKNHVNPADFPFAEKLKDNQPIYDLEHLGYGTSISGLSDVLAHAKNSILSGKIAPEDVTKFSVEQAARDLWAQSNSKIALANKNPELYKTWKAERHQTIPAAITYDDGAKMVLFDRAFPKDMLRRDISVDTKDLNHCVASASHGTREYPDRHVPVVEPHTGEVPNDLRGREVAERHNYITGIEKGDQEIASLRDPQGNAVATIDIDPTVKGGSMWNIEQISGKENGAVNKQWTPHIQKFLNDNSDKISTVTPTGLKNSGLFSTTSKVSIGDLEDMRNFKNDEWQDYIGTLQMAKARELDFETLNYISSKTGKTIDELDPMGEFDFWEEYQVNGIAELQKRFEEMGISPNVAVPLAGWYQSKARPIDTEKLSTLLEGEVPRFFTKEQIEQAAAKWGHKLFPNLSPLVEEHSNLLHDLRIARHQLYMNPDAATPQQIQELRDLSNKYYRLADAIEGGNKMPAVDFNEARKQVLSLLVNVKDFNELRRAEKYIHEMYYDYTDPYQYSMLQSAIEMKEQTLLDARARARGFKDGGAVKKEYSIDEMKYALMKGN